MAQSLAQSPGGKELGVEKCLEAAYCLHELAVLTGTVVSAEVDKAVLVAAETTVAEAVIQPAHSCRFRSIDSVSSRDDVGGALAKNTPCSRAKL